MLRTFVAMGPGFEVLPFIKKKEAPLSCQAHLKVKAQYTNMRVHI